MLFSAENGQGLKNKVSTRQKVRRTDDDWSFFKIFREKTLFGVIFNEFPSSKFGKK